MTCLEVERGVGLGKVGLSPRCRLGLLELAGGGGKQWESVAGPLSFLGYFLWRQPRTQNHEARLPTSSLPASPRTCQSMVLELLLSLSRTWHAHPFMDVKADFHRTEQNIIYAKRNSASRVLSLQARAMAQTGPAFLKVAISIIR